MSSKYFSETLVRELSDGVKVFEVENSFPLRRDLTEPLPPTPTDLDVTVFPPTIAAVKALLPATLKAQFEQEIDQTPFQQLEKLVMDWGEEAVSLHSDDIQASLEMIADDDTEGLKAKGLPHKSD